MSEKTDPAPSSGSGKPPDAPPRASSAASADQGAPSPASADQPPRRKPRISLFFATACGLGYLPKAPGTWGSLAGLAITWAIIHIANKNWWFTTVPTNGHWTDRSPQTSFIANQFWVAVLISLFGIWVADRAARYLGRKDPQNVVIDEVSGQMIAFFSLLTPGPIPHYWKYLLLGFILFRVFDIWKPFPARQAESLPGGWGIMADDWIAGIYAGLGLWLARALGL
ncbi:MAG TPA: phosphatidylglycerophosphatase A [Candidatus Acidoferrales bacterium]|nr:phosphatidylglycerophosphatase A [Candidatus Acidoferrales bacterium]